MRRIGMLSLALTALAMLIACRGENGAPAPTGSDTRPRLSANYANALPVEAQLAAGTLQLESGDLAVSVDEATQLLPLWQALQALKQSATTASAEMEAVVNQLQDTLSPAQVAAIADMHLTSASLQELIQSGAIAFGRGRAGGSGDGPTNGQTGRAFTGGGFPGGFAPPDGGEGGGLGGPGGVNLDPNALATRRAQLAEGTGAADFQTAALTNAVIRLLEIKTGTAPSAVFGGPRPFDTALNVVAQATGLTAEAIQTRLTETGVSLRDIVIQQGGDADGVRRAIAEALAAEPALAGRDLESVIAGIYEGAFNNTTP